MPTRFTLAFRAGAILALALAVSPASAEVHIVINHAAAPPPRLPPPKDAGSEAKNVTQPAFGLGLPDLQLMMLEQNPRLSQARFAVDAAAARAHQAGLYPNPTVGVVVDELGDRQGPAGIITAPQISQEIVTAGKLGLNRAAAQRETDQAALAVLSLRYARLAAVRQAYYEILMLRRRIEILDELVKLSEESVKTTDEVRKQGFAARLDVVQLEVERERFRAEKEAVDRELPPAFRRLAAAVGVPRLLEQPLLGRLDESVPAYELESAREFLSRTHPDILAAKKGVDRAQLLLERARVEPIPNITVQAGYTRQNQNKSNDALIGFTVPVPCWNRNEGNIAAAQAHVGEAIAGVGRVENELIERLADAMRLYASAQKRAELYSKSVLPRARESYQIALKNVKSGVSDSLRVLEAQRAYAQADLEYVRSLGEAWRAAAELSGLLLEEAWPARPQTVHPVAPPR